VAAAGGDGVSAPDTLLRDADAAARALAQREFARPLVLEAGAGTGKTATLVARVLAWALGPGWESAEARIARESQPSAARVAARVLDGVVAITFTEAAAAEMARRVDAALAELLEGRVPVGVEAEALPPPLLCHARAAALRGALDHLQLQTIHAWCRRLLASHPLAAGVHPGFQVDADGRLAADAARAALEARLRAAYEARDPAALALAEAGVGPAELEEALIALLERGVRAGELSQDPASPARIAALGARLRAAFAALRGAGGGALGFAPRGNHAGRVADAVQASLDAWPAALTRETWAAFAAELAERFPKALRDLLVRWARGSFGAKEGEAFGSGADAIKQAAAPLARLLAHALALDLPRLDAVRALLGGALADAEDGLRRRGAIGFAQLLDRAAALLCERPDVAAGVRSGIEQLLVDEFQDTDRRQCAIVAALALEGPAASRPGLFLVGDPKQSIYGWRDADLAAYEGFVAQVLEAGGERRRLSVNHRSVRSVLAEVERVIAPVMQPEPGLQPGFEPLVAREDADEGDAVEYWLPAPLDPETRELARCSASEATALEARALARRLRALHEDEGVPWNEMAVLMRSRGDWDVFLEALRARAIPFSVEGDRSYYRRREIVEAAAWLRCVLDPDDAVALVTALRSSAVGVPDAAWIGLFAISLPARAARLRGTDADELATLARDVAGVAERLPAGVPGLERVRGWESALCAALEAIGTLRRLFVEAAPDAFVEALRDLTCFEASESARFLGAWRAANLERFFRGVSAQLAEGVSAAELLRALRRAVAEEEPAEEMQPRDLAADGVRMLTLHGAKGLDFGHVFLAQLHKGSSRVPPQIEFGRADGALEYKLLGAATPGFDRVVATREAVTQAERVRLLYVGMTRARRRLVLSGLWRCQQTRAGSDALVQLLEQREPAAPAWSECRKLAGEQRRAFADGAHARWRMLALEPDEPFSEPRSAERASVDVAALDAEAARLRDAQEAARARMARRRGGRASAERHERGDDPAPLRAASPAAGLRIGTLVHAALEAADFGTPDLRAELLSRVPEAGAEGDAARALLERVAGGPLGARLRALHPHVVARELPLLLPPSPEDEAVGYLAGSIDLVFRDPDGGEWVVVDYKTDRSPAEDPADPRHADYRRQGSVYRRALMQALELPSAPRLELWWLAQDRIEVIPPAPGGAGVA
jgi:ATP-dependent helicase/nuclease subunit A